MTNLTTLFDGIPRAPFQLLGYDLTQPDNLLHRRRQTFSDRYWHDVYPIALACAVRLNPGFSRTQNVDQLLDPTFQSLAKSFEVLLADYLKDSGFNVNASIVITPLRGELAYVEPLDDSSYRIVINEYLLLVIDSLIRYVINCTENSRPSPATPAANQPSKESREGIRLAAPYQSDRMDEAFEILNADFFVQYVVALFVGLAPGVCDNPKMLDDFLTEWAPSMSEEPPFGYQDSYEEYYVECYLMLLACVIGHETAHLTEGHFKGTIHETQHHLLGRQISTSLSSINEMQADVKASDFAFHACRALELKDISSRLTGHVLAFCLPSLLEGISHQLRHGPYDDNQACLVGNIGNARQLGFEPDLWNTHMSHIERCGVTYAHAVSCLDKHTNYENEDYIVALQAAMYWVCCVGGQSVEYKLDDMVLPSHRHPLLLQTSLQERLAHLGQHDAESATSFVRDSSYSDLVEWQVKGLEQLMTENGSSDSERQTISQVFSALKTFAAEIDGE